MTLETYELDKKMLEYSISQFRNIPEYVKICEAFCVGLGSIQDGVNYLSDMIDLDKAAGIWLDYIGWLVGVKRTDLTDTSSFFCVNITGYRIEDNERIPTGDVNEEKYFWFANQEQSNNANLDDEYYRSLIKAKIGYNTSRCTRNDNIKNIKNFTFANHVIIDNVEPMVLDITLYGDNIIKMQNIRYEVEKLLGDGVGIRNFEIKGLNEYEQ